MIFPESVPPEFANLAEYALIEAESIFLDGEPINGFISITACLSHFQILREISFMHQWNKSANTIITMTAAHWHLLHLAINHVLDSQNNTTTEGSSGRRYTFSEEVDVNSFPSHFMDIMQRSDKSGNERINRSLLNGSLITDCDLMVRIVARKNVIAIFPNPLPPKPKRVPMPSAQKIRDIKYTARKQVMANDASLRPSREDAADAAMTASRSLGASATATSLTAHILLITRRPQSLMKMKEMDGIMAINAGSHYNFWQLLPIGSSHTSHMSSASQIFVAEYSQNGVRIMFSMPYAGLRWGIRPSAQLLGKSDLTTVFVSPLEISYDVFGGGTFPELPQAVSANSTLNYYGLSDQRRRYIWARIHSYYYGETKI